MSSNKSKTKLSNSYTKNTTHTRKTTAGYSNNKIARDLREEFDQYVLKQQDQDSKQFSKQNSNLKEQQEQDQDDGNNATYKQQDQHSYDQQKRQPQNYQKIRKSIIFSTNKKPKLSVGKQQILRQSSKIKINTIRNPSQINLKASHASNTVYISKSYLLAMQHLQDLLQRKDQQINDLKMQLIEKQQIILESEERINEVLKNYHALMDMYTKKQNQVTVLKEQMQQLRIDKQNALKHAAKFIQPQYKPFIQVKSQYAQPFTTFKHRSMSSSIVPPFKRQQMQTALLSKQLNNIYPSLQLQNIKKNNLIQIHSGKISEDDSKTIYDNPFSSSRVPLSQKSRDRDFISYQRQILRNQKQLIALKYRMECLQRKLSTDPKQQSIKQKIRKLTQQIQHKQKIINDLKKI